jgi:hypothetical protein
MAQLIKVLFITNFEEISTAPLRRVSVSPTFMNKTVSLVGDFLNPCGTLPIGSTNTIHTMHHRLHSGIYLAEGILRFGNQCPHFISHDGKSAPGLPCPGGLNRSIQSQEVSLVGNIRDDSQNIVNVSCAYWPVPVFGH